MTVEHDTPPSREVSELRIQNGRLQQQLDDMFEAEWNPSMDGPLAKKYLQAWRLAIADRDRARVVAVALEAENASLMAENRTLRQLLGLEERTTDG